MRQPNILKNIKSLLLNGDHTNLSVVGPES